MTSTASGICSECRRPRRANETFCECGALLDYSVPGNGNGHKEEKPAPAAVKEWPPEPPYTPRKEEPDTSGPPLRVIYCPNERCGMVNPERLVICWNCKKPLREGDEVKEPWSWRQLLRWFQRSPLRPGQRERPRPPFFSKNPRDILRSSAIVVGVLAAAGVLVVAAIKGWQYGSKYGPRGFSAAREWVFPRFRPHHPSSVFPTRYRPFTPRDRKRHVQTAKVHRLVGVHEVTRTLVVLPHPVATARDHKTRYRPLRPGESVKGLKTIKVHRMVGRRVTTTVVVIPHPAADAFDRNLSTYWQSRTPRRIWDRVRLSYNPPVEEFDDVSVFAGDPTAKTIVPRALQIVFYTWQPHRPARNCRIPAEDKFDRHKGKGTWCVIGKPVLVTLLNKPTEQRFSFGPRLNVGRIVITIRGTHHSDNPKAKAALTDVEFFDRF